MTLEEVANRKKIEFKEKVKALEAEINQWCEWSKKDTIFEKHNSQIRAIQAHLKPWNNAIRDTLNKYEVSDGDIFLKYCKNAENLILSAHRVWDYFRKKFILRKSESFQRYLKVADEFAWVCYEPILSETKIELKEPPLVFFNGGISPFSVSRKRTFQTELVDGKDLSSEISNKAIVKLPISVVGVPWDQINHLPEASVIGHEIGHIIENDFELTDDLERLLDEALTKANADSSRKEAWHSWLSEIFADLYGCLSVGVAYAGSLLDYLVDETRNIEGQIRESGNWTSYPTNFLRMKIIFVILENMGFTNEIKSYVEIYNNYGSIMSLDFENDIYFVVESLLMGKFYKLNGKKITDVFNFTSAQQKEVNEAVEKIKASKPNVKKYPAITDIRVFFAAIRTSYEESPQIHIDLKYNDVVLDWIHKNSIKKGVRSIQHKDEQYQKISEDFLSEILVEYF